MKTSEEEEEEEKEEEEKAQYRSMFAYIGFCTCPCIFYF